jgi:modulator of FtsH protease HflK
MSSTLTVRPVEIAQRRPRSNRTGLIVLGLFCIWLLSGIYLVQPDQQAVVTRFGAVAEPRVTPGLHFALPWPVDRVYALKVQQQKRLMIGGELPDGVLGRTQPLSSQFISGDQNVINVRVVVQYSISDPARFLFQTEDASKVIGAVVEAELTRRIGRINVDDILTTEKVAIQSDVRAAAQRGIDIYRIGVALSSVNIDNVAPPAEAADAFRDVAGARADAIRIVNEAEGYANDLVPRARGEAAQLLEAAHAYKDSRVNRAAGDAARFTQVAAEYQKAPQVTAERAYVEAMEQILPKIRKLIVDPDGNFDLTLIRRGDGSANPKR